MRDNAVWKHRLLYLDSFDETSSRVTLRPHAPMTRHTFGKNCALMQDVIHYLRVPRADAFATLPVWFGASGCVAITELLNIVALRYRSEALQFRCDCNRECLLYKYCTTLTHCMQWVIVVELVYSKVSTSRTYLTFNFTKFWSSVTASGSLFNWLSWTFEQGKYQNLC